MRRVGRVTAAAETVEQDVTGNLRTQPPFETGHQASRQTCFLLSACLASISSKPETTLRGLSAAVGAELVQEQNACRPDVNNALVHTRGDDTSRQETSRETI